VHANSPRTFNRVVLYDLGLSPFQRRLASSIRGVEVRRVPPFSPHWRDFFTWKPWIWTHLAGDEIIWLDAGTTVLRPLTEIVEAIRRDGYFLVTQCAPLRDILPRDYYRRYGLSEDSSERDYVAAGVMGFDPRRNFFDSVLRPTYEDCLAGLNLGCSIDEIGKWQSGINRHSTKTIRDCPRFRHDQSLLNAHIARAMPEVVVHDLFKYAGPRSLRDDPGQLIWHHRRRGNYAYLPNVPYDLSSALIGKTWGLWFRCRWWAKNHSWLFRPAIYARKAKRLAAAPFER